MHGDGRDAVRWNFSVLELFHRFGPIITDDFTWAPCALELFPQVWTALNENQSKCRIAHIPLKVGAAGRRPA